MDADINRKNSSKEGMRASLIRKNQKCYEKAEERAQMTFTLVEQDATAPTAICFWITMNIGHVPADKLRDALESAIAMQESLVPKKFAD